MGIQEYTDREIYVCKFGGSSVANAGQIKKVEDIVKSDERRRYIVVSAPGKDTSHPHKVTDILFNLYFKSSDQSDKGYRYEHIDQSVKSLFDMLNSTFMGIVRGLSLDPYILYQCMDELRSMLEHPRDIPDAIISRGEHINARLVASYLGLPFIDSHDMIFIGDDPDSGNIITYKKIKDRLSQLSGAVIPGFYGSDSIGHIRTFARGGSDLTGSLVAAGLEAAFYENWTDQSGIRCVDPRLFPDEEREAIRFIEHMTFREARELTYSGFEVFNDKAIGPVRDKQIPVNVRNTNRPSDPGTLITSEYKNGYSVRGIAGRTGFWNFIVERYLMNQTVGFGRDFLDIFSQRGLSYEHTPSGIDNMSVIIDPDQQHFDEETLVHEIKQRLNPDKLDIIKDLALIAVVGEGMKHNIGMAAKIMETLSSKGINIEVIDQCASESNIIIGVNTEDYQPAVRALYYNLFKQ